MAYYRRKFYPKRKSYRKRYGRRTAYRRRYNRKTRTEYKCTDVYTTSAVNITPYTSPLYTSLTSSIAKGTDGNARLGEQILLKSIQCRFNIECKQGAPETDPFYNTVRMMIIEDKQPNGSAPDISDLLSAPAQMMSPMKAGYFFRYRVLYDKIFEFDYDDPIKTRKIYKRVSIPVRYVYGTAVPTTNNVFAVTWSDQADDYPKINYFFRLRFTDN